LGITFVSPAKDAPPLKIGALYISEVEAGMPAELAGIQVCDRVTSIEGIPVTSMQAFSQTLTASGEAPVQLTVERGGELKTFSVGKKEAATQIRQPQSAEAELTRLQGICATVASSSLG
jgi:S1-C subfamily serine protease